MEVIYKIEDNFPTFSTCSELQALQAQISFQGDDFYPKILLPSHLFTMETTYPIDDQAKDKVTKLRTQQPNEYIFTESFVTPAIHGIKVKLIFIDCFYYES